MCITELEVIPQYFVEVYFTQSIRNQHVLVVS
jgi:hypothetical protein